MAVSATGNRDDSPRLPPLSLGLSSVRFIVNKLEAECARVTTCNTVETTRELVKYDPNIDEGYDDYDDSPLVKSRGQVWNRFAVNLGDSISRCIPSVTFGNFGVLALTTGLFAPKMITYLVVYPFCRLVFGTLYPAYASYKAVRTKNLKEYVKWMMYWIVFALFTCTETFTDVFLSWFPFYYEVKIVLVLWLLSPATKGSSILYRKFVHPALCRREQEIDEYIAKAKDQGYHTVLNLGSKGVNYATTVIMQTAIKGGGGLVQQLRKSYSLSDLTECEPREERGTDEADDVLTEPRLIRRSGKSASESNSRSPMYFPEVDVNVRPRPRSDEPDFSHIKSSEDISSGYSSADNSGSLTRTASLGAAARARSRTSRTTVTTIKRPQAAEESEVIEELQDDDNVEYLNMPPLINTPSPLLLSHTQPPFIYQYVGDQVKILQVLGNYPLLSDSNNPNNHSDNLDQTYAYSKDFLNKHADPNGVSNVEKLKACTEEFDDAISEMPYEKKTSTGKIGDDNRPKQNMDSHSESNANSQHQGDNNRLAVSKDHHTTSLDQSLHDNDSVESDDEASFGTPENSPKIMRMSPKGKYGKAKAPPPPTVKEASLNDANKDIKSEGDFKYFEIARESVADIISKVPNSKQDSSSLRHLSVNPIAENKRRHKSKSPGRTPKSNSSGLGKLLQLPGRLAFWNKTNDTPKPDDSSISSREGSRSSTVDRFIDEFQSCMDLNTTSLNIVTPNDLIPADDMEEETDKVKSDNISKDIIDKSDALQKLIDAKLETHPEYNIICLHGEMPAASKSTDV